LVVKYVILILIGAVGGLAAGLLAISGASADEPCGLCAKEIVTNSELATCFLDQYDQISKTKSGAVAVDLSNCASRGVVEALPSPTKGVAEPDVQFMISRQQLDCLKQKLEQPGLVLDPSAKIDLGSCG
jgi:hypothetical protein